MPTSYPRTRNCAIRGAGRRIAAFLIMLLAAALAACGGSVSVSLAFVSDDEEFLFWAGNSNRDLIVDANHHEFAFFADSNCLYNFQTGRENREFCLAPSANVALYRGFPVRIANIRSPAGDCIAALLDEATAKLLAIEWDRFGTEFIIVSDLRPALCAS